jgi:hypothetical protein
VRSTTPLLSQIIVAGKVNTGMLTLTVAEPLTVPAQVPFVTETSEYVVVEDGVTLNVCGFDDVETGKFVDPSVYTKSHEVPGPVKFTVKVVLCPSQIVADPESVALGPALTVTFAVVVFGQVPLVKLYVTV